MSDKTTQAASYISSGTLAFIGAWTIQDWAIAIGIVFTMLTFLMNWYYTRRRTIAVEQASLNQSYQHAHDNNRKHPEG